jgi:nicotinate-nucleotide--dimethylbenzimidazole phosphoribosyltransferase
VQVTPAPGTLALPSLRPLDATAMAGLRSRLDQLTKPPGSLGRLEELAVQVAGITGDPGWTADSRTVVVFAADHGVVARGVSAYPQAVTAQMVANFLAGGAAINVLARLAGADVLVVDAGVATALPAGDARGPGDLPAGVRFRAAPMGSGTLDMTVGPAMSRDQAEASIRLGLEVADAEAARGAKLIGTGEMGIGNTTSASAITALITGEHVEAVTGRGTGLDAAGRTRKVAAIERAIAVNRPDRDDAVGVLAAVGGFEIGALAGLMIGAAARSIPVVLDGFITGVAALLACELEPLLQPRLVASHVSAEPGHRVALEHLRLRPLLDLELRLGEGTGAALSFSLFDAACAIRDGMATFASAGVSTSSPEPD